MKEFGVSRKAKFYANDIYTGKSHPKCSNRPHLDRAGGEGSWGANATPTVIILNSIGQLKAIKYFPRWRCRRIQNSIYYTWPGLVDQLADDMDYFIASSGVFLSYIWVFHNKLCQKPVLCQDIWKAALIFFKIFAITFGIWCTCSMMRYIQMENYCR